jgi:threonine synthase
MENVVGLRCIRCRREFTTLLMFKGCPYCLAEGSPSNVEVVYDYDRIRKSFNPGAAAGGPQSMWRYLPLLPPGESYVVTMGEGLTPLVPAPAFGADAGVPNLFLKEEGRNATWSFKSRLASSGVSSARQLGAKVIVGSSSGNAGAAVGAYCARAGLPCVMFTTAKFPPAMKVQMAVYGAKLISAPSVQARWKLVAEGVDRLGWFPIPVFMYPPIGSTCYGVEGYKTIAYEIIEQLGRVPDCVVSPVGAGDAFFGMWKGFAEYRAMGWTDRVPRMIAAEVFGSLEDALQTGSDALRVQPSRPTGAISVGVDIGTYQALHVLRETGGLAASPSEELMRSTQRRLAEREGIYAEVSSVISTAVLRTLVERGEIKPGETVVAILTSSGLKDPGTTQDSLPSLPACDEDFESALRVLRDVYQFDAENPSS